MKKLKLDLDDLQVESFATEPEAAAGSVFGYYGAHHTINPPCSGDYVCSGTVTCDGRMTCDGSATCDPVCNDPGTGPSGDTCVTCATPLSDCCSIDWCTA